MAIADLVDRLEDMIRGAKVVPFTDQVRLNRGKAYGMFDDMRAAVAEELGQAQTNDAVGEASPLLGAINRFDELIHQARAIPLTSEVRMERAEADEQVAAIRAALAAKRARSDSE